MTKINGWKNRCAWFLLYLATTIVVQAQTFTTLVDFEGTNGSAPTMPALVQGSDGNYYGTTSRGGTNQNCPAGCGTVIKVTSQGQLTTLYDFCSEASCVDGFYPLGGVILSLDGSFYGTTSASGTGQTCTGCGTVFKLTPDGKLTTLHSFDGIHGDAPKTGLVEGTDGRLYGATVYGGITARAQYTWGTIFRVTKEGVFDVLHSFQGPPTDGAFPYAPLMEGPDGDFYGTTSGGGPGCTAYYGCGTIFKITRSGQLTILHFFNFNDGAFPFGPLTLASDGNFYGTTSGGGKFDNGTVFRATPSGTVTTLYSFSGEDGENPDAGLVQGTDGNFYGTTSEGNTFGGTVFAITPDGALTTLHSFDGPDGREPLSGLLQATNGSFYGTTAGGGDLTCNPNTGCGTVFKLDMGLSPFVTFVRFAGKVGQTGPILGQSFTGTTSVAINGIQADFTVVSDTLIRATVPPGATTGYVTVATPTGVLTSNAPFHVIQ